MKVNFFYFFLFFFNFSLENKVFGFGFNKYLQLLGDSENYIYEPKLLKENFCIKSIRCGDDFSLFLDGYYFIFDNFVNQILIFNQKKKILFYLVVEKIRIFFFFYFFINFVNIIFFLVMVCWVQEIL